VLIWPVVLTYPAHGQHRPRMRENSPNPRKRSGLDLDLDLVHSVLHLLRRIIVRFRLLLRPEVVAVVILRENPYLKRLKREASETILGGVKGDFCGG